jgi:hypothetical protein
MKITGWKPHAITLAIGILIGLGVGYKLYSPDHVTETYKPQVVTENGAVALERIPDLPPPEPIKEAAKELGGKLVRAGTVIIQPKPTEDSPPECKCKEVELNFGVVEQNDGNRILFETDDGLITGGTDSPLVEAIRPKQLTWDVGVIVPIDNPKGIGPSISKRMGNFKVGVAAAKPKQGGWTGFVTASISF